MAFGSVGCDDFVAVGWVRWLTDWTGLDGSDDAGYPRCCAEVVGRHHLKLFAEVDNDMSLPRRRQIPFSSTILDVETTNTLLKQQRHRPDIAMRINPRVAADETTRRKERGKKKVTSAPLDVKTPHQDQRTPPPHPQTPLATAGKTTTYTHTRSAYHNHASP